MTLIERWGARAGAALLLAVLLDGLMLGGLSLGGTTFSIGPPFVPGGDASEEPPSELPSEPPSPSAPATAALLAR